MMKRFMLIAVCVMALSNLNVMAQGYSSLWKQVSEAEEKDLPKSAMKVLEQIVDKAKAEKSYGQLLKANMKRAAVQTQISPDSTDVEIARVKEDLAQAEKEGNRVLAAVYQSVLGRIYSDKSNSYGYRYTNNDPDKEAYKVMSKEYYDKSMEPLELLANEPSKGYEPALIEGTNSSIFTGDMLHVLGFEAKAYKVMHDWYLSHGNRRAACICAYYMTKQEKNDEQYEARKSKYLHTIDSLINEYQDLKECGELAIERYNFIDDAEDTSAEEKMNYINYALQHWGAWPRMNVLRNAQNQLTLPTFTVDIGEGIQAPNTPRKVYVREIVNCQRLTMTVQRVKVDGDTELRPSYEEDYAKLKKLVVNDGTQQTVTRRYIGQPDYKVLEDSMTIGPLPIGVYLVEFTTDKNIKTKAMLLHVSDLFVIHQEMPDNRIRLVAVSAQNGTPIENAKIRLRSSYYSSVKTTTLTTNQKGEAEYQYDDRMPNHIYVYTDKDKACPEQRFSDNFRFYDNTTTQYNYNLLTDRKIYRPGQTVHAALIVFKVERHEKSEVMANKEVDITLRNANHEVVETKHVTTDEYGKAATDFVLPSSGLTGQFSLSAYNTTTYISVEEYKRPTFQVEFDEVTEQYEDGDTVTVVGNVHSYAGVPVQGARVKCKVTRKQASWWWYSQNENDKVMLTDSLVTNDNGRFEVRVPMELPKIYKGKHSYWYTPRFYSFVVEADATDAAGESHHGETSLPLSNRKTAFSLSMPSKIEADSTVKVRFSYLNNAGNPITGDVKYRVMKDLKDIKDFKGQHAANESFEMNFSSLKSGRYTLEAICGEDSVQHEFIVFSMKDKHPATETHDWFYISAKEFPRDARPIYVQMGSSDKDQHIVYSLISGNTVLEKGVIDQSNAVTTRQFTYKEEYGDGVLFTCAWVREGKLYCHSTEMRRPLPDKRLNLSWKTFRDRLTPGQKEEWILHIEKVAKEDGETANTGASLLAVLFDKSLDDIRRHYWLFGVNLSRSIPHTTWQGRLVDNYTLHGEQAYRSLYENPLSFTHFDSSIFDFDPPIVIHYKSRKMGKMLSRAAVEDGMVPLAAPMEVESAAAGVPLLKEVEVESNDSADESASGNDTPQAESNQVRENLNETAFFYPTLLTDENGDVAISFTLPESITTWRFMGLATDKDVRYGTIESETVAKKDVMIQPNMPRFFRLGDKGQIAARIFNTAENDISGMAKLELIDPETEKVVYSKDCPFTTEAGKTTGVAFDVDVNADTFVQLPLLICRVKAAGKGFSDGEQHYLPILPSYEQVINTVPFTQHGPGTKTIDLTKLFGKGNAIAPSLTVEYTNNPVWLMIQALPTVANDDQINAISQAAAFYSNSIANHLLHQTPTIKTTIEQWKREQGNETSLMSSLEKNQELKTMVLEETPWVADARHESNQKQLLSNYFDENAVNYRLSENINNLKKLQNSDGSWSWWPGMHGSFYMTVAVSKMFVRLNKMLGEQKKTSSMLEKAYKFMGKEIREEVELMKKWEKDGAKDVRPSETAIDWLYLTTLDGRELTKKQQEDREYLVNRLARQTRNFTIYGKAVSAVILGKNGYEKKAKEYLQSIDEYSVYTEEMGRYYDTRKAYYSWFDYKIPTEVAAIEAFRLLKPEESKIVEEMQRWLLQAKRTQSWDTPINTVNAVYAFLSAPDVQSDGSLSKLSMQSLMSQGEPTVLKVDNTTIDTSNATAGLGYIKDTRSGDSYKTFTAEKTSQGTSWGAIYAVSLQPVTDIEKASSGLTVTREVIFDGKRIQPDASLKVGDRIKIRITINAERDYDFVQVSDKRAACLEPLGQLSGYHWGYYCAPRDNTTNYYFDRMAKGTHIVETEYYIDRVGTYQTGTCTVQCAYSPEYSARSEAKVFKIEQ